MPAQLSPAGAGGRASWRGLTGRLVGRAEPVCDAFERVHGPREPQGRSAECVYEVEVRVLGWCVAYCGC